jgi:alpha-1,3-rhamnosyl/mannosyltransferase
LKVGFGTTVWCKGVMDSKLDGIGIYSKNIYQNIIKEIPLSPIVFGNYGDGDMSRCRFSDNIYRSGTKFPMYTLFNRFLKVPYGSLKEYQESIDIFFAPDHYIPPFKNIPVVATVMDLIPIVHPEWTSSTLRKIKNRFLVESIKGANHIITISEYSKSDIVKMLDIDSEKIDVIDLGVDEVFFDRVNANKKQEVLKKYDIKEGFFLSLGTLQPRKNVVRTIKAHQMLPKDIKKDHPLIIVGKYGWRGKELLREIEELEDRGDGKWLYYIPQRDIYAILQSSLAVVYPSLYEGFGLPILEAFASEVPIITSNVTSIPEVAFGASIMVDPYSIEDISNAMRNMATDDYLRVKLVEAGKRKVVKYKWGTVAKKHLEVLSRVYSNYSK